MAPKEVRVCSFGRHIEDYWKLEVYERTKLCEDADESMVGYSAARKALTTMSPDEVIEEVKRSGLRGKGGAGFNTGLKWSFMPKDDGLEHFLVVNGDESEPGTANDREIMTWSPHLLLEGIIIASYAIRANTCYIYIRGEMFKQIRCMNWAIEEAYEKGYLGKNIFGTDFSLDVYVQTGAGAYICGEETALLSSLMGERGYPRPKPPFPAQKGAFDLPTTVNNVQTIATVPAIIALGADWHLSYGTEKSPGMRMFCVSGHVERPGHYEFPFGITLRELIYDVCGGPPGGKKVKAVIPGGSSAPMIPGDATDNDLLDTRLTYEDCVAAGTLLGSGAVIVLDEETDIVWAAHNLIRFYAHESCGKCTPCREGTPWMRMVLERIMRGEGVEEDVKLLSDIAEGIETKSFCALGDAAAWAMQGALRHFSHEFEEKIRQGKGAPKVFQASYASGLMSLYQPTLEPVRTHRDPRREAERIAHPLARKMRAWYGGDKE